MDQDQSDFLNKTDTEDIEQSALRSAAKRRRLLLESDSDIEVEPVRDFQSCVYHTGIAAEDKYPSQSGFVASKLNSRLSPDSNKDEGPSRQYEDIAEVYGDLDEWGDDDYNVDSDFCAICDDGGHLLMCDGPCMRSFHASEETAAESLSQCISLGLKAAEFQDRDSWYCLNCKYSQQQCFICGRLGRSDGPKKEVYVCDVALCGRFYHLECLGRLKEHEETIKDRSDFIRSVEEGEGFCCPAHSCRRCGKGDEESADNSMKLAKCRRCPKAFHKMCLPKRHDIEEDLETPARDHIKWPGVPSLKPKGLKSSVTPLKPNFQKMTQSALLKQKHKNVYNASSFDQSLRKVPLLKRNLETRPEAAPLTQNHLKLPRNPLLKPKITEKGMDVTRCSVSVGHKRQKTTERCVDVTRCSLSEGQRRQETTERKVDRHQKYSEDRVVVTQHVRVDQRQKKVASGQDAINPIPHKQRDTAMRDRITPDVQRHTVERGSSKGYEEVRPSVKQNLISREAQQTRISRLMQQAASQVTLEDVKKILVKPSCYQENKQRNYGHRGWIESTLTAGRKAWNVLKSGGNIEDAKRLCTRDSLCQLLRTLVSTHHVLAKSLEVYLSPLVHGPRYTSFGRHFTRVDKLQKIVDRIHPYIDRGDMVVDFCCGANDFSVLLNKKLTEEGKSCEFRNFDIHPAKDTFCFQQGDWFQNNGRDFYDGSKLIIGLNPPFGYMAALADKFILHALRFRPKLLILIVPPETMSSSERYRDFDYHQVWRDDNLMSGKAFFIPGSMEESRNDNNKENENMLQWNKVTPPLFLWSRGDMIGRHEDIARRCQHISGLTRDISGSQEQVLEADGSVHLRARQVPQYVVSHEFGLDTTQQRTIKSMQSSGQLKPYETSGAN